MKISIFKNPDTVETSVEFYQVVNAIKLGKHQNTAFAPSGIISISGKRKNLLIYTGLVLLSFDGILNDEFDGIFQSISKILTTYCCFKNRLGNGINVLIKTDCLDGHHKTAYKQVVEAYENHLGLKVSNNKPDEFTLCPLSYDPNIYYNETSNVFQISIKTKKAIVTEAQLNGLYKEGFDKAVEYTERIVRFGEATWDKFIYTLAINCVKAGIPQVKTLEFVFLNYGYELIFKGKVNNAYKKLGQIEKEGAGALHSLYFKKFSNYKPDVKCDVRVFFEVLIFKSIYAGKPFYYLDKDVVKEVGISRARRETIVKEFIAMGFLKIYNDREEGYVHEVTIYELIPENIPKAAVELMVDASVFLKKVMPLLNSKYRRVAGYSHPP